MRYQPASERDLQIAELQLGRPVRGVAGVAWRCPCGEPGVLATYPRLPADRGVGTPFPTIYYLTCPQAVLGCSRLEASGLMAELTERLAVDPQLAAAYQHAHEAYLADRAALEAELDGPVPEIAGVSAGGMPTRVKCLHALVGHALAAGPGVNPIGDLVLERLGDFCTHPCLDSAELAAAGISQLG